MQYVAVAFTFSLGFLAWLVPMAAVGLALFFTAGTHAVETREMLIIAGVTALLTLALPLGLMVWQRWQPAAIAYAAGMVVGTAPLYIFLNWFLHLGPGSK